MNTSANGTFEHNDALIFRNPSGAVDWNELYVSGVDSFPRTMGTGAQGDPIRPAVISIDVNFTENANGATLFMIGIHPASETFTDWESFGNYSFHNGNNVWAVEESGFATNLFEPAFGYILRMTMGETQGALYQYSTDDGATYTTVHDSRGVSGGTDTDYKPFFMYNQAAASGCADCFVSINEFEVCYPDPSEPQFTQGGFLGIDNVQVGYGVLDEIDPPVNSAINWTVHQ